MEDHSPSASPIAQPPISLTTTGSNMPMLYYGALMVGTVALVLALCNLIVVRWCLRAANVNNFGLSFKHKRNRDGSNDDSECVVCLSAYEEGEELRQLPKCNHSFHAPCIDMWLHSHIDCPLCRDAVRPPKVEQPCEGMLVPITLF